MNHATPPPSPATPTLAPCPFCGGTNLKGCYDQENTNGVPCWYECQTCFTQGPIAANEHEADERWNHREPSLASLQSRLAEVERDAARYQWLRSEEVNTDPRYYPFWEAALPKLTRGERLDALVDKWMTMDFCEHDNDAATCGECHGQFGVGA